MTIIIRKAWVNNLPMVCLDELKPTKQLENRVVDLCESLFQEFVLLADVLYCVQYQDSSSTADSGVLINDSDASSSTTARVCLSKLNFTCIIIIIIII